MVSIEDVMEVGVWEGAWSESDPVVLGFGRKFTS